MATRFIVTSRTEHQGGHWVVELGPVGGGEIQDPITIETDDERVARAFVPGHQFEARLQPLDENGNPFGAPV
jgi:hypothetical protein